MCYPVECEVSIWVRSHPCSNAWLVAWALPPFREKKTTWQAGCLLVPFSLFWRVLVIFGLVLFVLFCFSLLGLVINLEWMLGRVKVQNNHWRKRCSGVRKSPGQRTEILNCPLGWQWGSRLWQGTAATVPTLFYWVLYHSYKDINT